MDVRFMLCSLKLFECNYVIIKIIYIGNLKFYMYLLRTLCCFTYYLLTTTKLTKLYNNND